MNTVNDLIRFDPKHARFADRGFRANGHDDLNKQGQVGGKLAGKRAPPPPGGGGVGNMTSRSSAAGGGGGGGGAMTSRSGAYTSATGMTGASRPSSAGGTSVASTSAAGTSLAGGSSAAGTGVDGAPGKAKKKKDKKGKKKDEGDDDGDGDGLGPLLAPLAAVGTYVPSGLSYRPVPAKQDAATFKRAGLSKTERLGDVNEPTNVPAVVHFPEALNVYGNASEPVNDTATKAAFQVKCSSSCTCANTAVQAWKARWHKVAVPPL
jgi:hypothetical protein